MLNTGLLGDVLYKKNEDKNVNKSNPINQKRDVYRFKKNKKQKWITLLYIELTFLFNIFA